MLAILIAVIALIAYGSLFPWTFKPNPAIGNPFLALLTAHASDLDRRFILDIVVNVALYIPLGLAAYTAFHRFQSRLVGLAAPVLLGVALSASVEILQFYVPTRRPSVIDLATNTLGTILGVALGLSVKTVALHKLGQTRFRKLDRSALALILTWVASLTCPWFPIVSMVVLSRAALIVQVHPLSGMVFVSALGSWYAAGVMLRTLTVPPVLTLASIALVPAQIFIVNRSPTLSLSLGAVAGAALAFVAPRPRFGHWLFLGLLAVRGLTPFQFGPAHTFSFIPFQPFLNMSWLAGYQILLDKLWYLGAGIWLLQLAGIRLKTATGMVVAVSLVTEIIQTFMPARTPDITDPILALLLGLTFRALRA